MPSSTSDDPEDAQQRVSSIVALLVRRLGDAALGGIVSGLLTVCNSRPACAAAFTRAQTEHRQQLGLPRDDLPARASELAPATVTGTDAEWDSGRWRLLFGTPVYTATVDGHEPLNTKLRKLLAADMHSGDRPARSLVGNGWRTDDDLLQRKEPAIVRLHKLLLAHVRTVINYGQTQPLNFRLQLSGWAVALGGGGSMREHVHPMVAWSGVYYVHDGASDNDAAAGGRHRGGCLRLSDPRPGAMMVTMGPNDSQFMESRTICPRAGLLVMFPAWISHSVTPLLAGTLDERAEDRRLAIAFNVNAAEE
jgi:uncharacterized protein (TIGR02466 family)